MSRTALQIYAAAVCFASVTCLAIAIGIASYSSVAMLNPSFTLHPMSMPMYAPSPFMIPPVSMDGSHIVGGGTMLAAPQLSAEELATRRAAALETAIRNELATAKQSLLRWGIAALISGILFVAHWRILRRENGNVA